MAITTVVVMMPQFTSAHMTAVASFSFLTRHSKSFKIQKCDNDELLRMSVDIFTASHRHICSSTASSMKEKADVNLNSKFKDGKEIANKNDHK